jgi:F0F1-type ATP synthase assembly protein I
MAEEPRKTWASEFGLFLTMGIQLALAVVVFFFLGRWLDTIFDCAPWLMITGLAIGIIGGLIQFFRAALALGKREDKEAEEHKPQHDH